MIPTTGSAIELGTRVQIHGTITKTHVGSRTEYLETSIPWDYTGSPQNARREYREGIVVGKRTYQTGTTSYTCEDRCFAPDGSVTAYIVAYHLHRKPALCLPEQIEPLGGAQ